MFLLPNRNVIDRFKRKNLLRKYFQRVRWIVMSYSRDDCSSNFVILNLFLVIQTFVIMISRVCLWPTYFLLHTQLLNSYNTTATNSCSNSPATALSVDISLQHEPSIKRGYVYSIQVFCVMEHSLRYELSVRRALSSSGLTEPSIVDLTLQSKSLCGSAMVS